MTAIATAARPRRKREKPKEFLPPWLETVAKEPTYAWAIKAWRRASKTKGAWYDYAKADQVVALWPTLFRLTDDRFAGEPFYLLQWQEIVVRLMVGWKIPVEVLDPRTREPMVVHVRLFRRLRLWVPRKNGKSEFLAALALLFWVLDGIVGGQGYVFARKEEQAEIPFNKMKAMVGYCPQFAADIIVNKKSLYLTPCAAAFKLLSGADEGEHGKGPYVVLGDEMHEWKSRKIESDLRQGSGTRLQPVELYGSTSGLKTNLVGVELWDESLDILEGRIEDPTTLVVLFAAQEEDDWEDEAVWARANPSLGLSPTLHFLRLEAAIAKGNPRKEATFRCYHLNQWVDSTARWLPIKKWDACSKGKTGWTRMAEQMRGRRCWNAFDVSATQDFTTASWLFEPEQHGEPWHLLTRFWLPEETLEARIKRNPRVPYAKWKEIGAFETTPGDSVDQNYVLRAIEEGLEQFEVLGIAGDPWNARKLFTDLEHDGVDPELFLEVRQGILSMGEPSKHFERLVFKRQLDHGAHPVLRWMAGNTVVRFDENLNFMPAKKKSAEKIDGIVSGVIAVAGAFNGEPADGPSVYEERGIVEIEV